MYGCGLYDGFKVINRNKPSNLLGPSSIKLENKGDLSFFYKVDEVSPCSAVLPKGTDEKSSCVEMNKYAAIYISTLSL